MPYICLIFFDEDMMWSDKKLSYRIFDIKTLKTQKERARIQRHNDLSFPN